MHSKYPDMDYRLFQSRQYDYEKEAEMERLITLCKQKRERRSYLQGIKITIWNMMKYLYRNYFRKNSETRQFSADF